MPAHAREDIVRGGEVASYHCWSRCVPTKTFLCGFAPKTQRDFDDRRGWIEDLLAYQAGVFALDVGNFNLLSNHAHTILRTRSDIAATWSDEELALRWKMAWLVQFEQLEHHCSRVLGAAHRVAQRAGEMAQRWIQRIGWCHEIFAGLPPDAFT